MVTPKEEKWWVCPVCHQEIRGIAEKVHKPHTHVVDDKICHHGMCANEMREGIK